ncbi:MAG: hypothetical protein IKQ90_01240, partial [Ruminococcus sp.]|nr:hypothetical protein [Ruminococcus sp.]
MVNIRTFSDTIKSVIIAALVIFLAAVSGLRLMEIQVVGSEKDGELSKGTDSGLVFNKEIKATRGEIIDYSGNLLVTNDARCDLVLQKAFFPDDLQEGNETLLNIYNALLEYDYVFKESLPITRSEPYKFTVEDTSDVVKKLNLNVYASAENCIDKLISDYKISDKYTAKEKRIIAGMRYEMLAKEFSYSNDMLIMEDVDPTTVIEMKELGNFYKGIEAVETSERKIVRGDILPHEIGTVGPIYAEEYDELKQKGYALNDTLGKSGIEAAMETELRGQNDIEAIT